MSATHAPIYLDHHATTRVDPRVVATMAPLLAEQLGNASNPHHLPARRAADLIDQARAEVAALLHADPREVIFTSGATEANNLAVLGVVRASPPHSHLIVSAVEHASVLEPARRLQREGYEATIVPVDRHGRVAVDEVAKALTPRTVLVSIMTANNEVGTIQPVGEIAALCARQGVVFHTDAVQSPLTAAAACRDAPADLVSLSAHKIYGPMGVGALLVRRKTPRIVLQPLMFGGGQEHRQRPGTLPTPLIAGFGVACRLLRESHPTESQHLERLRNQLWSRLQAGIPGVIRNGDPLHGLPGNLHVSIPEVDGDALLARLTRVAVSSGAACSAGDHRLSHVPRAMGIPEVLARASLRFGIGRFNTPEDIDRAADAVIDVVQRLRAGRRGQAGEKAESFPSSA
jgi:cysteine desulfurase